MSDLLSPILDNLAAASLEELRFARRILASMVEICPRGDDFTVSVSVSHALSGAEERRDDPERTVTLTPESRQRAQAMLKTVQDELRRRGRR